MCRLRSTCALVAIVAVLATAACGSGNVRTKEQYSADVAPVLTSLAPRLSGARTGQDAALAYDAAAAQWDLIKPTAALSKLHSQLAIDWRRAADGARGSEGIGVTDWTSDTSPIWVKYVEHDYNSWLLVQESDEDRRTIVLKPGGDNNMAPTFCANDRIEFQPFDGQVTRGQLLKFSPSHDRHVDFARALGLPGETVTIVNGGFTVNGEAVDDRPGLEAFNFDAGPILVPAGSYFVTDDNRKVWNSTRTVRAFVKAEDILGILPADAKGCKTIAGS